jgi:hypothetical protein
MIWRQVRDGAFLTRARVRAYVLVLSVCMALTVAAGWGSVLLSHDIRYLQTDRTGAGRPAVTDFLCFWAAARVAVTGAPQLAYQPAVTTRLQARAAALPPDILLTFLYPPVFLLLCLPFGFLPYPAALVGFVLLTGGVFLALLARLFPRLYALRLPLLAAAAFPAVMDNVVAGQTGFLTAAALAGGALFLERRPALAGACLGFLVCKPHLALCVPVALICARRWRATLACGATAAALAGLSAAVLGIGAWRGFLSAAPFARQTLDRDWSFSLFTAARMLGAGVHLAGGAQAVMAAAAVLLVAAQSWRRPGALAEMAVLAAASLALPPHVMDYDLVALLIPAGWMVQCGLTGGWLAWERTGLVTIYLCVLLGRTVALTYGVPLGPLGLALMLALVAHRAHRKGGVA